MKETLTIFFIALMGNLFAQVDVTFQVDMSGQTISADGVHIAGSLNGWNTSSDLLVNQGGNIYAITLSLMPGDDFEYKYLNGNAWGTEETPPAACTVGGNNRTFTTPSSNTIFAVVPFNGCQTPNPTQEVTFNVDMTGQTISPNGVHVVGNFNGWSPSEILMTDIGNNIYQVTVTVLSSLTTVQYKYLNGNAWGTEETVPAPCVNTNNNRQFVIGGAGATVNTEVYQFGTCMESILPLPIELISFAGNETEEGIVLRWQTASEENNKGFQLMRSQDGRNWEMLKFKDGNGTSQEIQDYNFLDEKPFLGINYYQLKQLDYDGTSEFSKIIIVNSKISKSSISTFPNPVQNELNIINASGELTLFNVTGQLLKRIHITDDVFKLDMIGLNNGIYFLKINDKVGKAYHEIIIK